MNNSEIYKRLYKDYSKKYINKIFKMSGMLLGKPLSYVYLRSQYEYLKKMTYEERVFELGLNPDRADVIIPASKIYLKAMKWSKATKIYVPKIGLSDGMVYNMYQQETQAKKGSNLLPLNQ